MSKPDPGFDFDRYRKLLAEATDEPKRVALIETLVAEGAWAKLAAQRRPGFWGTKISPAG
jgi:hypothetical protein